MDFKQHKVDNQTISGIRTISSDNIPQKIPPRTIYPGQYQLKLKPGMGSRSRRLSLEAVSRPIGLQEKIKNFSLLDYIAVIASMLI